MISNQEFFDKTVRHLHQQRGPSRDAAKPEENLSTMCLYRGNNGRSCAIGCHIPDRIYKKGMEARTLMDLLAEYPEVGAYVPEYDLGKWLQLSHDRAAYNETDPPRWVKVWFEGISVFDPTGIAHRLVGVAIEFNLDPAVVYECWPKESV